MTKYNQRNQNAALSRNTCHLLRLPAELRNEIYENVLSIDIRGKERKTSSPALLNTCFKIYRETNSLYIHHLDAMADHARKEIELDVKAIHYAHRRGGTWLIYFPVYISNKESELQKEVEHGAEMGVERSWRWFSGAGDSWGDPACEEWSRESE